MLEAPPPARRGHTGEESEHLRELKRQKRKLDQEISILNQQTTVLDDYSKSMKSEHASSAQLAEFLDVYATRQRSISDAMTDLQDKLAKVATEIQVTEKELKSDEESLKRAAKIVVIVLADKDGPAELSLSYGVQLAYWTPLYDLRASIASNAKDTSKISLHYRASIQQATGEDWSKVHLTLSTASPQTGSKVPDLKALRISEDTPPSPPVRYKSTARKSTGAMVRAVESTVHAERAQDESSDDDMGFGLYDDAPAPSFLGHNQASNVDHGQGFSSTFQIEGLSTIPSDKVDSSESHKVTISVVELDNVLLQWVTVPKEAPTVFFAGELLF